MLTLEDFTEMMNEIYADLPEDLLAGLNLGIIIEEGSKLHSEAIDGDLFVLGEYRHGPMGSGIVIYYGSFSRLYPSLSVGEWAVKAREVLYHELRHHLERKAKNIDLELEDARMIEEYKQKKKAGRG